jgi:uncharacterized protein (DUF1501 family)
MELFTLGKGNYTEDDIKNSARAFTGWSADHGTAAPMFLVGKNVKPGLHGPLPDLANRDANGDLIHMIDFRGVYAAVLREWFAVDPQRVLLHHAEPLSLIT